MTGPLEQAFGIGRKLNPVEALEEVATALEQGQPPSRGAASLVATAIRKCLSGQKPEDRDLLAAAGWKTPSGGRFKTPAAMAKKQREVGAASQVLSAMPGAKPSERADQAKQLLVTPLSELAAGARELADVLRAAGFNEDTSARLLRERAAEAAKTAK